MIKRILFFLIVFVFALFPFIAAGNETVIRFDADDYQSPSSIWDALSVKEDSNTEATPAESKVTEATITPPETSTSEPEATEATSEPEATPPEPETTEATTPPETLTTEPETPATTSESEIESEANITDNEFLALCSYSNADRIKNAIENQNANPSAKDINGMTALMYAAKSNPDPNVIIVLADNGAYINDRDKNRVTALMYAARYSNADIVDTLINSGAEDLADKRGWTALFWAARYTSDPKVIGVLLDHNADTLARAHDMTIPFDHAQKNQSIIDTEEYSRLEEESR